MTAAAAARAAARPAVRHAWARAMHPARDWHRRSTFHHAEFPPAWLAEKRTTTVSICLPARDEASTIGPIVDALVPLLEAGVADQLVVVDDSADGTGAIAAARGAEVHRQADLRPELGPVLGKGDAMWRSLGVLTGDLVCFLDADSGAFGAHFATGLLGPLVAREELRFVKGFYRRPFRQGGVTLDDGGGRVTELCARPLLNRFYPALAGFRQPLAGEIAARRELLERLPFLTGYAVDVALLIDAWREAGLDALAQVDLDVRHNDHQPLSELGPMASAVLHAVTSRLEREGRLGRTAGETYLAPVPGGLEAREVEPVERPPLAALRAAA